MSEMKSYSLQYVQKSELFLDLGYEGAEKFLFEAFNLRIRLYGSERAFLLANTMNKLGIFYAQKGEYEKAEVMFEVACTILRELTSRMKNSSWITPLQFLTSEHFTTKPIDQRML